MANAYREAIKQPSDRVILALDGMNWGQAENMVGDLREYIGMAKANSLAQRHGWLHAVNTFADLGVLTMADAKFHDTPGTVKEHLREVTETGAGLITVHISGGREMLQAACDGRNGAFLDKGIENTPFLKSMRGRLGGILGITVLTSLGEEAEEIYGNTAANTVIKFAEMASDAGLTGIVCSGKELEIIRARSDLDDLITVVPGINLEGSTVNAGQKRVVTPAEAIRRGADFVVLGSTVTISEESRYPTSRGGCKGRRRDV